MCVHSIYSKLNSALLRLWCTYIHAHSCKNVVRVLIYYSMFCFMCVNNACISPNLGCTRTGQGHRIPSWSRIYKHTLSDQTLYKYIHNITVQSACRLITCKYIYKLCIYRKNIYFIHYVYICCIFYLYLYIYLYVESNVHNIIQWVYKCVLVCVCVNKYKLCRQHQAQ